MKTDNFKIINLLQPISLPQIKFEHIITDLLFSNGFTAVAIFIYRLTKYARFSSCTKKITVVDYSELFFKNIFPNGPYRK